MDTIAFYSIGLSGTFFAFVLFSIQIWPFGSTLFHLFKRNHPESPISKIRSRRAQLANRITAIVHNMIQIPLALYLLRQPEINQDRFYGFTKASTICLSITVGYFIVDTLVCLRYLKEEGFLFLFHAVVCLFLFLYGALYGFFHYYGISFLLWELSTPFVHARWLMHHLHMEHTKIYFINGLLMLISFFSVRCVYGIAVSVDFWKRSQLLLAHPKENGMPSLALWTFRVFNVGLNALNLTWMWKMIDRTLAFLKTKSS